MATRKELWTWISIQFIKNLSDGSLYLAQGSKRAQVPHTPLIEDYRHADDVVHVHCRLTFGRDRESSGDYCLRIKRNPGTWLSDCDCQLSDGDGKSVNTTVLVDNGKLLEESEVSPDGVKVSGVAIPSLIRLDALNECLVWLAEAADLGSTLLSVRLRGSADGKFRATESTPVVASPPSRKFMDSVIKGTSEIFDAVTEDKSSFDGWFGPWEVEDSIPGLFIALGSSGLTVSYRKGPEFDAQVFEVFACAI